VKASNSLAEREEVGEEISENGCEQVERRRTVAHGASAMLGRLFRGDESDEEEAKRGIVPNSPRAEVHRLESERPLQYH
jgi:hypothetical protein